MLLRHELIKDSWDYYKNEQTKEIHYTSLVGPRDFPAVYLNKETMAKFKPQLQKYYYNPAKNKTYMEQLGITYPTLREDQKQTLLKK